MKRKIWIAVIGIMSCMIWGCGNKETDWGPESPEVLPSGNAAEAYVTPEIEEIINLSAIECQTVSVVNSHTILVRIGGEEKEIVLYGIVTPDSYEDQAVNHLQKIIPETVCIDYIKEETGEAYVWQTNDITFFSNCINYRMCYDGYAVMDPSMEEENRPHYEKAEEWARGTESGLWANTGFEEAAAMASYSVSGNNVSESDTEDTGISNNSVPESDNTEASGNSVSDPGNSEDGE